MISSDLFFHTQFTNLHWAITFSDKCMKPYIELFNKEVKVVVLTSHNVAIVEIKTKKNPLQYYVGKLYPIVKKCILIIPAAVGLAVGSFVKGTTILLNKKVKKEYADFNTQQSIYLQMINAKQKSSFDSSFDSSFSSPRYKSNSKISPNLSPHRKINSSTPTSSFPIFSSPPLLDLPSDQSPHKEKDLDDSNTSNGFTASLCRVVDKETVEDQRREKELAQERREEKNAEEQLEKSLKDPNSGIDIKTLLDMNAFNRQLSQEEYDFCFAIVKKVNNPDISSGFINNFLDRFSDGRFQQCHLFFKTLPFLDSAHHQDVLSSAFSRFKYHQKTNRFFDEIKKLKQTKREGILYHIASKIMYEENGNLTAEVIDHIETIDTLTELQKKLTMFIRSDPEPPPFSQTFDTPPKGRGGRGRMSVYRASTFDSDEADQATAAAYAFLSRKIKALQSFQQLCTPSLPPSLFNSPTDLSPIPPGQSPIKTSDRTTALSPLHFNNDYVSEKEKE